MASPPFNINQALPQDTDIVSAHPTNARAFRDITESYLNTDHDFNTGGHNKVDLSDLNGSTPTIATNRRGIWQESGVLKTRLGAGSVADLAALIGVPAGAKVLFFQAAAPAGYVQDSSQNDRVLRVVSGAGGGTGGSWTISGITVDGHALTVAQMPAHDHGGLAGKQISYNIGGGTLYGGGGSGLTFTGTSDGGGATHTHGLTIGSAWRPSYIDVIVCTKS